MAFDGSGVFLRLRNWVADAAAGVKIRADFHDIEDNNFADGLSHCIVKDGQTTITQNIPWNSKRITALADPVNAQDAATMAYADTKLAKTGDGTITGNLTVTGNTTITGTLTVGSTVSATGYQTRQGQPGPYTGHYFNFDWTGSVINAWIDNSNIGALATQAYANTKLAITGGTITGGLTVNGELVAVQNYIRFGTSGSNGYLLWGGGTNYTLGGGVTIWHSGNFTPGQGAITSMQLAYAGSHNHTDEGQSDPFAGGIVCGLGYPDAYPHGTLIARYRYLQAYTNGNWYTVGYYQ